MNNDVPFEIETIRILNAKLYIFACLFLFSLFFFRLKAYRTPDGRPWVLPVVKATEIKIAESETINHEYLPVCGPDSFTKASVALLLGEDSPAIKENRAHGVQSLSGTGALRLGAEFLSHKLGRKIVYYSDPTWGKFLNILRYFFDVLLFSVVSFFAAPFFCYQKEIKKIKLEKRTKYSSHILHI